MADTPGPLNNSSNASAVVSTATKTTADVAHIGGICCSHGTQDEVENPNCWCHFGVGTWEQHPQLAQIRSTIRELNQSFKGGIMAFNLFRINGATFRLDDL